MAWNNCIIHIMVAIVSYLFWLAAALSGAVYFCLQRADSKVQADEPSDLEGPFAYWERMRYKLTITYVILGLLFFTGALAIGFLKANVHWKQYGLSEPKIAISCLMWVYYFALLIVVAILKIKRSKKAGRVVSVLAAAGVSIMVLNVILSCFSKMHHYL